MFTATNTRRPATGGRVFESAEYFEMVFLETLPSAQVTGFLRSGHIIIRIPCNVCKFIHYSNFR